MYLPIQYVTLFSVYMFNQVKARYQLQYLIGLGCRLHVLGRYYLHCYLLIDDLQHMRISHADFTEGGSLGLGNVNIPLHAVTIHLPGRIDSGPSKCLDMYSLKFNLLYTAKI